MTVLIYVDTSKQVGDKDHLKVFANQDAASVIFVSKFACLQPPIYFVNDPLKDRVQRLTKAPRHAARRSR
jgi:hypothetical protein